MGEADVNGAAGHVAGVLRDAGRAEGTVRREQAVLERFTAFFAGRGLDAANEQVCIDFTGGPGSRGQVGVITTSRANDGRPGGSRAGGVGGGRAGRSCARGRPVGDTCEGRLSLRVPLAQDDYLASCPPAANAEATVVARRQGGQPLFRPTWMTWAPTTRDARRAGSVGLLAAPTRTAAQDRGLDEILPGGLPRLLG